MEGRRAERRGKEGWKMQKPLRNYERRRQIEKIRGVRRHEDWKEEARRPQVVHFEGRLEKVRLRLIK